MNMFLHELKAYRKSTITWTLSLVGLILLFFSMFPSISKEAEEFKKIMEGFPEALRLALGISVENIGSILGFYSYVFLYISLCGAIQAMNLGTSIVSKEVREKTADFLLSKPVTRTQVMTSKLLAALASLVITNVFYLTAAVIMASLVETKAYSTKIFLMISLTLFFLQLIFLALGIIVSVVVPKIKSVLPISLGIVFTFFIISALASTTGDDALRYITPFKYFDLAYIVQHSSYEPTFVMAAIGFIAAAITISYFIYCRKDIHAV
ncbi:ABC-2 type transport system permease protein [Anaerosolibacter carboniphilus]|uniref:ABC-2 type transport system permease protein n=1 Tax=Anaerosolibacter carboniphilus TaxID=1417629 RepID=A0A841KQ02_9FIRM|nr:ABC transporter permease subunit [Anaerosolibacter carboniphilus]MBB6215411.1 ABC-2 type transport system permease protein [Anaerosolibacter carboniphilus]